MRIMSVQWNWFNYLSLKTSNDGSLLFLIQTLSFLNNNDFLACIINCTSFAVIFLVLLHKTVPAYVP